MAYRIKNTDPLIGYYADGGWDQDATKAKEYQSEAMASQFIAASNMSAKPEEFTPAPTATGGTGQR